MKDLWIGLTSRLKKLSFGFYLVLFLIMVTTIVSQAIFITMALDLADKLGNTIDMMLVFCK